MDAPLELIINFRELYKNEIKTHLENKDYMHAYLLMIDPATAMREDWQSLTAKFHYALGLAATAYGLVQDIEKYVRNPSPELEKNIGIGKKLLEMAVAQSELPKI